MWLFCTWLLLKKFQPFRSNNRQRWFAREGCTAVGLPIFAIGSRRKDGRRQRSELAKCFAPPSSRCGLIWKIAEATGNGGSPEIAARLRSPNGATGWRQKDKRRQRSELAKCSAQASSRCGQIWKIAETPYRRRNGGGRSGGGRSRGGRCCWTCRRRQGVGKMGYGFVGAGEREEVGGLEAWKGRFFF